MSFLNPKKRLHRGSVAHSSPNFLLVFFVVLFAPPPPKVVSCPVFLGELLVVFLIICLNLKVG